MTTKRKILLLCLPLCMLACKMLLPEPAPKPEPVIAPTPAWAASTPRPAATAEAGVPASAKRGFTHVRLNPADGDLPALLAAEAQKAAALGQMPIAEFDAPW